MSSSRLHQSLVTWVTIHQFQELFTSDLEASTAYRLTDRNTQHGWEHKAD